MALVSRIDVITIPTTGNSTDFGDITLARRSFGGCSSFTRGLCFVGYASPGESNVTESTEMQSLGNASDFGNATAARGQGGGASDATRAIFAGGTADGGSDGGIRGEAVVWAPSWGARGPF